MQNIIKIKNYLFTYFQDIFLALLIIVLAYSLINYPQDTVDSVSIGMGYCINILIPSLFPFMFLSRFAAMIDLVSFARKPIDSIMKILFYLPGSAAPVIILSLIGGYPAGASGVNALLEKKEINSEQLNRLMCFTVNAGPAFIINVIGYSLLKSPTLGAILFVAQTTVSIGCGIILGVISRLKNKPFYNKTGTNTSVSNALVETATQTSFAIIMMCTLILVFNLIISIVKSTRIFDYITALLQPLNIKPEGIICLLISCLEITSGCSYAAEHFISLPLIAFIISYGGICTHFQISSILKSSKLNYLKFHIFRIINACCCYVVTYIILNFFEFTAPAFISTANSSIPRLSVNTLGSIAIIALCIYFTLNIEKR